MDNGGPNRSQRLDSWKAIASYLNRDERTVRRWERERGLPVRRVPGGRGTSVFAFAAEIDAWLNATADERSAPAPELTPVPDPAAPNLDAPVPGERHLPWKIAGIAAAVLAIAFIGAWRLRSAPLRAEDFHAKLTEDAVSAIDGNGREIWRRPFPADYKTSIDSFSPLTQVVGGSHPAVYAAYSLRVRRADERLEQGELLVYSLSGALTRTFHFDDHASFDHRDFGPPWVVTSLAVSDRGGVRRIAVAAHHMQWSASMVAVFDGDFHRLGTYWQWGWIEAVKWLAPDRLLIGGFDDVKNGGMLALLDSGKMSGQAPVSPGVHGYCDTCGSPAALHIAVMPRTEVNRVTVSRFNRAVVQLETDRIVARTIEVPSAGGEAVDALYEYSPQLDLITARFGGPYWELHEALHARGQLAHDREHCPDRDGPREILMWDAAGGWQRVPLNRSE